jgi:NTE family protein
MTDITYPRGVVLALSGGGAKGLAHIGVLQVLQEAGIPVRAVAGTSVGAQVGAFLAIGMPLEQLTLLATSVDWKQTLQLFLPDLPTGGIASGKNIMAFLNNGLGRERLIEELAMGYVAVAADLETGEQVVLDRGSLIDAVRASLSVPAMLAPFLLGGRLLVDGGVVNPVPFDVARTRFGGPVLAVAVNAGALNFTPPEWQAPVSRLWLTRGRQLLEQPWMKQAEPLRMWLQGQFNSPDSRKKSAWGARRVLDRAMDVAAAQLVRVRTELNAPELMLVPDVRHIGPLEFYRGKEAIAAGREAAAEALPAIRKLMRGTAQCDVAKSPKASNVGVPP